ncbi:MAG: GMC oxidoreductase, partial [Alphaproteobacteria bacterium]
FKRMENFQGGAGKYHGTGGPVTVTVAKAAPALLQRIMETADKVGLGSTSDIHGDVEEGFAPCDCTVDERGRRVSTYRAYLKPVMNRPNLHIEQEAFATRILLDGKRATGIEYRKYGQTRQAFARRETLLSLGSFNSPQLLMLSGIGPAGHLREVGVEVRHDLPGVGQNYSEHAYTGMQFAVNQPVTMLSELRVDRATWAMLNWGLLGRGAFTTQIIASNAMIKTREGLVQPDMQVYYNPIRMDAGIWWPWQSPEHRFSCALTLLHPLSRGWVKLRSADPADAPRIQPNLLADPADVATFVRAFRLIRKLVRTPPQSELTGKEITPGAEIESDQEIEAFVRETAATMYHPVGTCTMGTGAEAVVDPELRVHGIANLRVIDASIMPTVPGGNTNAPSMMIGEKGADLLRGRSLPAEDVRRSANAA